MGVDNRLGGRKWDIYQIRLIKAAKGFKCVRIIKTGTTKDRAGTHINVGSRTKQEPLPILPS
jgi:hypothetical protein